MNFNMGWDECTLVQREPVIKICGVSIYIEKYLPVGSHRLVENLWEEVKEETQDSIIIEFSLNHMIRLKRKRVLIAKSQT